jgi:hypothetical protein
MDAMALSAAELHALSRKYALLGELRRRHDSLPPPELRPLAREFPGSLRELDALPLDEIDRRFGSVELSLRGGPTEALIEWVMRYHELMRTALSIKRGLGGRRQPTPEEAELIARRVSRDHGVRCDAELVLAIASPPNGRINEVVFLRLAVLFGVAARDLQSALFREPV